MPQPPSPDFEEAQPPAPPRLQLVLPAANDCGEPPPQACSISAADMACFSSSSSKSSSPTASSSYTTRHSAASLPCQFLKFDTCAGNHPLTNAHAALLSPPSSCSTARKMPLPIYGLPSVRQPVSSGIHTKDVAATVQREDFGAEPPSPPSHSPAARFCAILRAGPYLFFCRCKGSSACWTFGGFTEDPLSTLHKHSQKTCTLKAQKKIRSEQRDIFSLSVIERSSQPFIQRYHISLVCPAPTLTMHRPPEVRHSLSQLLDNRVSHEIPNTLVYIHFTLISHSFHLFSPISPLSPTFSPSHPQIPTSTREPLSEGGDHPHSI